MNNVISTANIMATSSWKCWRNTSGAPPCTSSDWGGRNPENDQLTDILQDHLKAFLQVAILDEARTQRDRGHGLTVKGLIIVLPESTPCNHPIKLTYIYI